MIIIIDGPDGSGKTYIAEALARDLILPYSYQRFVCEENKYDTSLNDLHEGSEIGTLTLIKNVGYDVLFDRHYPSEFVYGQRRRGRALDSVKRSDDILASIPNHLIVICAKQTSEPEIRTAYKDFVLWSNANVMYLDTTDENLAAQLTAIKSRISLMEGVA